VVSTADIGPAHRFGRPVAIALVGLLVAAFVTWQLGRFTDTAIRENAPVSDIGYYRQLVERLGNGDSYYVAANALLRQNGYPTGSVINWRPPWLYRFIALVSVHVAHGIAILLSIWLVWRVYRLGHGVWPVVTTIAGVLVVLAQPVIFLTELWGGLLIAHAAVSSSPRGALFALVALTLRELVIVYVVAAACAAFWFRRREELMIWTAGLALAGGLYAWHVAQVRPLIEPSDLQHASYLKFNGFPFALSALRVGTGLFIGMPYWAFGCAFAAAVFAWCSPRLPLSIALTVGVYFAFFLVAGQSFAAYWGLLVGPTFMLSLGYAGDVLRRTSFRSAHGIGNAVSSPGRKQ
jgi:hypothetical protein